VLPAQGTLLVSTDMHGNAEDFRALREVFRAESARDPDTQWVILGDCVHGPDDAARREQPALYDYPDASIAVALGVAALRAEHPGRVHYVLGNHDFGHVGGPHTRKFHADEVAHLEAALAPEERAVVHALFATALLVVLAPCGALLAHGSPDERVSSLAALDAITFPPMPDAPEQRAALASVLTSYGQSAEVCARLLSRLSTPEVPLTMVIHGHDRDESGWFVENGNQLCPVLFGAPRAARRYVQLRLDVRYPGVAALRDGQEIRRLYP
jgi:hypothetical protein